MLAFIEEAAERGNPIAAVVCWDADRFSRASSIRTAAVIDRLMSAGVTRMLTAEGWIDWTNEVDCVLYNLKQDLAKSAFSKSISKNVTRTMAKRAALGYWCGSCAPFGYRAVPTNPAWLQWSEGDKSGKAPDKLSRLQEDAGRAEAVHWVFHAYAYEGKSLAEIAAGLERQGVPPPRGKAWTRYTVRGILTNPVYVGDAVWNARHKGKYHRVTGGAVAVDATLAAREGAKRRTNRKHLTPEANEAQDVILVRDAYPALVDRKTFALVQKRLHESFRKRSTPNPGAWKLAGLLCCGQCGAAMWGTTDRRKSGNKTLVYRHYVCSRSRRLGMKRSGCPRNRAAEDEVLAAVVHVLQEKLTDPGALRELCQEAERQAKAKETDFAALRKQLEGSISTLAANVDQGNRNLALLPPDRIAGVVEQMRKWEAERDQARRQLANLVQAEDAAGEREADVAQVIETVKQLHKLLDRGSSEEWRDALRPLIASVRLHFEHLAEPIPGRGGKGRRSTLLSEVEIEFTPQFASLLSPAGPRCAS
jgi:hypothetical protein